MAMKPRTRRRQDFLLAFMLARWFKSIWLMSSPGLRLSTGADRIDCAAIGDPLQAFDRERVNEFARSFGVQQHRARRIISHQPRKRANANQIIIHQPFRNADDKN